ncbi:MAG: hypothetical protein IPJ74_15100 [Saprospiraceae bacterium]|nr:hypothetical protein [Saprospiraceae bacterium]
MADAGSVNTFIENGIVTIEFFHPAHNAMPSAQLLRLTEAIQAAGENDLRKTLF